MADPGEQIVRASLDVLRAMTLEELQTERGSMRKHIEAAVESASLILDFVIAEKMAANQRLN